MALQLRLPVPRFISAAEIMAGAGSLGVIRSFPMARTAFLTHHSAVSDDQLRTKISKAMGTRHFEIFPLKSGEPTLESVKLATSHIEQMRPDVIVALGGGSVIDAAKLIWAFYEHPDLDMERALRPFGLPSLRGKAKFIAIPTTFATGAEVSSAAVFLNSNTHNKAAMVSHDFLPDLVILDPTLTMNTPAHALTLGAFDALTHAIEGYTSKISNPLIDPQAQQATSMIFEKLPAFFKDPNNLDHRLSLQIAAMMAGWVQNHKIPGLDHAIAHQLSGYSIPHSWACGALLGPTILQNGMSSDKTAAEYAHLAQTITRGQTFKDLAQSCKDLAEECNIEFTLRRSYPEKSQQIWSDRSKICVQALEDICAKANPVPLTEPIIEATLKMII